MNFPLSILTLNIWGIPFISKDKNERVRHIAERLLRSDYDIISLQEVWSEFDFEKIRDRISSQFPFSHYFYSGVFGSGLCIFSRHKIFHTFFHHWSVNGYFHKIQHGDWFGGKGVGLVKIKFRSQIINIYLAHLHAEYDKKSDDYMTHRLIQAFDTAQFIENTRDGCSMQILAGDLNTEPGDLAYRILLSTSKLKDSFLQKPSKYLGTHEYIYNSYSSNEISSKKPEGIRIDYILYRENEDFECKVENYELPFLDKISELGISYSDHEAVHAEFSISERKKPQEPKPYITNELKHILEDNIKNLKECIATCNQSLKELDSHRRSYTLFAVGLGVILINIVEISPTYGLKTGYTILKLLLCGLFLFFIFMATIWNLLEKHAVLAGKLSMEIALARDKDDWQDAQ